MTANYQPTPIIFDDKYEVGKMRRLAMQVTDLANTLKAVANKANSGALPLGGTSNQVLTWLPSTNAPGWAPAQQVTSFPYSGLTGVPSSFTPSQHLIANATQLGPAHTVQASGPGSVLKTLGTQTAAFQPLSYKELGDVDVTGLADGFVPAWSTTAGKWQMVPQGGGFSGLTVGNVYTATSPTTAAFEPLTFPQVTGTATPAQIGSGTPQYGLGDALAPNVNPAGTKQWSQLNLPANNDSLLTGDGRWTPIRDIQISWSQLTGVPPSATPTGGMIAPGIFASNYGTLLLTPGSAGNAITIQGWPNQYGIALFGSQAIGQSVGLFIAAGTSGADAPLFFQNRARTATFMTIFGDGHFNIGYNGTGNVIQSNAAGTVQVLAAANGQTLQANSNINGQGFAVNAQNGSGFSAVIWLYSNVTNRWQLAKAADAETGSNVGSTFQLNAYADAGTFLGTPFQVVRATGEVIITPYFTASGNGLVIQQSLAGNLQETIFNSNAAGSSTFTLRGGNSGLGLSLTQNSTLQAIINQKDAADIFFQFNGTTVGDWAQASGQLTLTTTSGIAPNLFLTAPNTGGVAGIGFVPFGTPGGQITVPSTGGSGRTITGSQPSDMCFRLNSSSAAFRFGANNGAATNLLISNTGVTLDSPLLGQLGSGTINVSSGYYVNGVNIFSGFQGTPAWQQVTAHVCAEWRRSGTFLIYGSFTLAQVGAAVLISQSGGNPEDENAQMVCTGYIRDQQTMVVRWISVGGPIYGSRTFSYLIAPTGTSRPPIREGTVIATL